MQASPRMPTYKLAVASRASSSRASGKQVGMSAPILVSQGFFSMDQEGGGMPKLTNEK